MPALDEPSREGAHLDHWTSLFLEGIIGLHNFQDAHGGIAFLPNCARSLSIRARELPGA